MRAFAVPMRCIDMIYSPVFPQEANFSWPCKENYSWLMMQRIVRTASCSTMYHSTRSPVFMYTRC